MNNKIIKLNNHSYEIEEKYDKGVIIYKNQEKVKTVNVYEYIGCMYMDGILVLVGHDDDVYIINLETLKLKHERFR